MEGCDFLKKHIQNDNNIQFRDFIKNKDEHEIELPRIINYLDSLSQLLPIKKPSSPEILNVQYRLFLRALVHEWEENIDPQQIKKSDRDLHTYAWLSKMTRNWTSHANLLEPLDSQIIAFLFLTNMRAMFRLPKEMQYKYEPILFNCISHAPTKNINAKKLKDDISYLNNNIDTILESLHLGTDSNFGGKINSLYRKNTGSPDAEPFNFKQFLLQYFWINQQHSDSLRNLPENSRNFLPVLAHHIYESSFEGL